MTFSQGSFEFFGGQGNLIFKSVLLDRFNCISNSQGNAETRKPSRLGTCSNCQLFPLPLKVRQVARMRNINYVEDWDIGESMCSV